LVDNDDDFAAFYMKVLQPHTFVDQMEIIRYVPVTSLMSVKQFAEYLTDVDNASASVGIALPHPEDIYYEAIYGARRITTEEKTP